MAKLTIVFGVLLVLLGLFGFLSTGHTHPTALIPSGFGLLLAIFGILANTPDTKRRMLFMHIAVTLGLLGFLATVMGLVQWFQLIGGKTFAYPAAVQSKAAMSVICLLFVILCVRSFITARRARA